MAPEGSDTTAGSSWGADRSHSSARLTAAVLPDMRPINPYQRLLADALQHRGIDVLFPEQLGGKRPLLKGLVGGQFQVLHLDWIHPYVMAPTFPRFLLRSALFLSKLAAARLLGRRIVWTVHNLGSHDSRFQRMEQAVGRSVAALSHTLVVHFPEAERLVRDSFGVAAAKEIWVTPHGHYMDAYPTSEVRSYEKPPSGATPLVFLAFGLVRPYKRLEQVIAGFQTLDREDVRLSIRGTAHDEEYAARLVSHAAADERVDLDFGFVEDDAVGEVFAAADVVVLTQTDTLTSGSLVLAMSMGKAVVAARTPHAEYLLGEGDHLYRGGDPTDLARALEYMADHRKRVSELGHTNRRAIASHTWSHMAEVVEQAYRKRTRSRGDRNRN